MKLFTLTAIAMCCFAVVLISLPAEASGFYAVHLAECEDSSSCPSGDDCSSSVTGCHGRGKCAGCNCSDTSCGCSCKKESDLPRSMQDRDLPDYVTLNDQGKILVAFDNLTDPVSMSFRRSTFDQVLRHLRSGMHPSWTLVNMAKVPNELTLSVDYGGVNESISADAVIQDIANTFGVCADTNETTMAVVFYTCQ